MQLKRIFKDLFLIIWCLLVSALPFRDLLNGRIMGEPFDTRLQIVLHEHWFWVIKGLRSFDDARFFYPYPNTLGFSDSFFVPGLIHSFFRILNFDIIDAWQLATYIVVVIGAIGFLLISKELTNNTILQLTFIYLTINNYIYLSFLNIWPNSAGYVWLSWPLLFFTKIYKKKDINLYLNLTLIFVPLLSLSFWYPGLFSIGLIIFVILFLFVISLYDHKIKNRIINNIKNIKIKIILIFSPIWIILWGLFVNIYWPVKGEIKRSQEEILKGSLNLKDFFSTNLLKGSYFQEIYNFVGLDKIETPINTWAVGFSPIYVITFILLIIFYLKKESNYLVYFYVTLICSILILFLRFNNSGIYLYLWNKFQILQIIRTPVRFNIFVYYLMLICIFIIINYIFKNKLKYLMIALSILLVILIVDDYRFLYGNWQKNNLINVKLLDYKKDIKEKCKYFSVTNPGFGHWSDTMEAMVLSSVTNVPTINGYSGTSPDDGIRRKWSEPSVYEEVIRYVEDSKLSEDGCIVDYSGVKYLNDFSIININGFDNPLLWENDEENYWVWVTNNNFKIELVNYSKIKNFKVNDIFLEKAPCLNELNLNYNIDKNSGTFDLNKKKIKLDELVLNKMQKIDIQFSTENPGCKVENDSRNLIYRIIIPKD